MDVIATAVLVGINPMHSLIYIYYEFTFTMFIFSFVRAQFRYKGEVWQGGAQKCFDSAEHFCCFDILTKPKTCISYYQPNPNPTGHLLMLFYS